MKISVCIALCVLMLSCGESTSSRIPDHDSPPKMYKTVGIVDRLSPKIDQYVPADAKIEVLAEGFSWSEGPLWLADQKKLIWSDVPRNIVYAWTEADSLSEYLNPSGLTGDQSVPGQGGSNGLMLGIDGSLILCQHGDRRVAKMNTDPASPSPAYTTIADNWQGKRLNSPNDLAYGPEGVIYFTDPPYGLPNREEDSTKEISFNGVYKTTETTEAILMDSSLTRPNGIAFNADMTRCYVANSDPEKMIWMVYDLDENHNLINGRVFFDATDLVATKKGSADGLKVNKAGIIFATGPGGVLIFSPEGEHLGTIETGERVANCCFNEDESVLYMTSNMFVARIALR
ncbi:MAG: SMP-30/gluconolactonase/LRE family protein [Bacteroidia bacterium]